MAVTIYGPLGPIVFSTPWEAPRAGVPRGLDDVSTAREYLRRLLADGHASSLRVLTPDLGFGRPLTDVELEEALAHEIATGRVRVTEGRHPVPFATGGEAADDEPPSARPPAARPVRKVLAEEVEPVEPEVDDTANLDQRAFARTLVVAAEEGLPFCEECEKARRAAAPGAAQPRAT